MLKLYTSVYRWSILYIYEGKKTIFHPAGKNAAYGTGMEASNPLKGHSRIRMEWNRM